MRTVVLALCVFAAVAAARFESVQVRDGASLVRAVSLQRVSAVEPAANGQLCSICVQFMDQAIGQLLNIIVNGGVVGGCSELCGLLKNKLETTVCSILCDIVGIEEFEKLIQSIDPDPIYYCEELSVCPKSSTAAGKISSFAAQPPRVQQGGTVQLMVEFEITNKTGTGQLAVAAQPPAGPQIGGAQLIDSLAPAVYRMAFKLQTSPSQQEPFPPGVYQTIAELCEGSCGSKHPDSYTMATARGNFTLTLGDNVAAERAHVAYLV